MLLWNNNNNVVIKDGLRRAFILSCSHGDENEQSMFSKNRIAY
jgi:hypothetical protein